MERNSIFISYYNYLLKDYLDRETVLAEETNIDEETGALMEWIFDFKECKSEQLEEIKEKSVDFVLETYSEGSVCQKVISEEENIVIRIYFDNSNSLKRTLSRPKIVVLRKVLKYKYQLYMLNYNISFDSIEVEEPQRLLGTSKRHMIFSIINGVFIFGMVSFGSTIVKYGMALGYIALAAIVERIFDYRI